MQAFGDFEGDCVDLLKDNYVLNGIKLVHKSYADPFSFKIKTFHQPSVTPLQTFIETCHKNSKYGTTITHSWDSANIVKASIVSKDYLQYGFQQGIEGTFDLKSKECSSNIRASMQKDILNAELGVNLSSSAQELEPSISVGVDGYAAGLNGLYNVKTKKLEQLSAGVGYATENFSVYGFVDEFARVLRSSLFLQMCPRMGAATQISWDRQTTNIKYTVGMAYAFDHEQKNAIKAKVDDTNTVTTSFITRLNNNLTLTFSAGLSLFGKTCDMGMGIEVNA